MTNSNVLDASYPKFFFLNIAWSEAILPYKQPSVIPISIIIEVNVLIANLIFIKTFHVL